MFDSEIEKILSEYKDNPSSAAGMKVLKMIKSGEFHTAMYQWELKQTDSWREHWEQYCKPEEMERMRAKVIQELCDEGNLKLVATAIPLTTTLWA